MDLAVNKTTVNGQIIQQSLVITVALPRVLVAAVLYLLLGLAACVGSFRTSAIYPCRAIDDTPELAALHLLPGEYDEKDNTSGRGND